MYVIIFLVKVTDWPPIGKIAAHSAYEMFSWYRYLIVSLVFPTSGFWSGNLLLIAPFPDLCLLVPFNIMRPCYGSQIYFAVCLLFIKKLITTWFIYNTVPEDGVIMRLTCIFPAMTNNLYESNTSIYIISLKVF